MLENDYYIWCDNGQVGFIIANNMTKENAVMYCEKWSKADPICRYTVCRHSDDEVNNNAT